MRANEQSYERAIAYAQALQAGSERRKCYEIAHLARSADENGIAFAIANDHRSEGEIQKHVFLCIDIGIAKDTSGSLSRILFQDGSTWELGGCSRASVEREFEYVQNLS